MADESSQNTVWNAYYDKHNSEPSNAQQLLNFSKVKSNNVTQLGFSHARKCYNRNKGKGRISNVSSSTNSQSAPKQSTTNKKLVSAAKNTGKQSDGDNKKKNETGNQDLGQVCIFGIIISKLFGGFVHTL